MTYTVIRPFVGVIAGVETPFAMGGVVSAGDALELGLAAKTDIAEPTA